MSMPYPVSAKSYLARAKLRLQENTNVAIFYAAFELRCCVESRQEEYLTAIESIKTKVKPWKIGETARALERVFESKKIARVTYHIGSFGPYSVYYTPVTKRLYDRAQNLGELLHCMKAFKPDDDSFWADTRNRLEQIYRDAWCACQGKLLTPPLRNHPFKVEEPEAQLLEMMLWAHKEKAEIIMKVEYLHRPPDEWTCDV
jgi:hypothetical protein